MGDVWINYNETDRIKDAAQELTRHVPGNEVTAQLVNFLKYFIKARENGRSAEVPVYRSGASLLLLATRCHINVVNKHVVGVLQ